MSWFAGFVADLEASGRTPIPRSVARWIYCVTEGRGHPVKIGITGDMKLRHENYRSASIRDLFVGWAVNGDARHERALKHLLAPVNLRGEWFSDADDALKYLLPQAASQEDLEGAIDWMAIDRGFPSYRRERQKRKAPEPVLWLPRHQPQYPA